MDEATIRPSQCAIRQGVEFTRKSLGWDCRLLIRNNGKRSRRHLGHIGKAAWEKMQAEHPTHAELTIAVTAWIEAKKQAKGINQ